MNVQPTGTGPLTRSSDQQMVNAESEAVPTTGSTSHQVAQQAQSALPGTSSGLSAELLQKTHRQEIIARCNDMESAAPTGIPVEARITLAKYLLDNQVNNPGGLTQNQRRMCRWALTEHAARNKSAPPSVPAVQWKTYIQPEDEGETFQLMKDLGVNPSHFKL